MKRGESFGEGPMVVLSPGRSRDTTDQSLGSYKGSKFRAMGQKIVEVDVF